MNIMLRQKLNRLMIGFGMTVLLSACSSYQNPLTTVDPKVAAEFLVKASQMAEKTLHVFHAPGGYYFGTCMRGQAKPAVCHKLYQAMVRFAKTTPTFKSMTVRDLTDPSVFQSLKSTYQREQFNGL